MALTTMFSASFFRSAIFPLLMVNFIGALGYSVILPFLVFLVQDFGGDAILYGFVAAVYPAFQLVGAPLLGKWSDQIGRKKVLLISQAGTLLSWLIFLVAFTLPEDMLFAISTKVSGPLIFTLPLLFLFMARAMDGLTGGNISVANAYLSDISGKEDRKANFGKMSASMNLGFIFGPVLAGLLASQPSGNMLTVIAAALISVVGLLVIIFFLPDIDSQDSVETCREEKMKKVLSIEHKDCYRDGNQSEQQPSVFRLPLAPLLIFLYFFIFLGFNLFYATFPVYASDSLQWTPQQLGIFFTLLSGVMILVQGPVLSWLSKRFSEEQLFLAGSLIMVICFVYLSQSQPYFVYLAAIFYGAGNGIMWPSYLSMLSNIGTSRKQGSLQGTASSFGSLASIIGLLAGGFILGLISEKVYLVSAGILLLTALAGIYLLSKNKNATSVARD